MADIDNELDDLYSQLSSLSNGAKSSPKSNSSGLEKLVSKKNINNSVSPNKIDRVKSIFASEINNRQQGANKNIFDSAGLRERADKQNDLKASLSQLNQDEINDIKSKVRDNLGKKENISGNIFKKINNNKPSFEIIDNSENAVTILDRDELISNKSLFVNQSKRKSGEQPVDRDNSNYVNTSAKLLKDNNSFAPLQLKKYNSR